ncbi:MAG TPA: ion transporter [Candidatus Paceibacterota bacterium]|nr:ion transporter [Candidatus Paceibacterota bacterium]
MTRSKRTLRAAFEDPRSKLYIVTNDVLAVATIVSVLALVLETVEALAPYQAVFDTVEYATVALFTVEYIGRLVSAKSKLRYVFSFYGMIDLLAIVPSYLALANLTFLKTGRAFRIIRFLRLLRLAKLARARKPQSVYALNIQIYLTALVTALLILGTLLFVFEGGSEYARDIPSAMFWTLSVILGGIEFQQPHTAAGTAILVVTRFTSLILLGLLISIGAVITRKLLTGSEKDDV